MGITKQLLEEAHKSENKKARGMKNHSSSEIIEITEETVKTSNNESVMQVKFYNPCTGRSGIMSDYRKEI